jgi:uncharacterized lipoprotein YajG
MNSHLLVKRIVFISCFFLLLAGCKKDEGPTTPLRNLNGAPSSAVTDARTISFNGQTLDFEVALYIVDKKGNPVSGLKAENFVIDDLSSIDFTTGNVSAARMSAAGDYSAMLLLDQSGSILTTDPGDLRIEAGKIFLNSLGNGDQVALSSFTSSYASRVMVHGAFTASPQNYSTMLDDLSQSEGGGTPLYLSTYNMIDYTSQNAPGSNKAVIVFTDGDDTSGGRTLQQVIDYANSKNIKLFTVGLSEGVDVRVLSDMALQTNGAFMWADDAKQLITMFGTLGDLLEGTASLYKVGCKAVATSNWRTGSSFSTYLQISLPTGEKVRVPFKLTVR